MYGICRMKKGMLSYIGMAGGENRTYRDVKDMTTVFVYDNRIEIIGE